MYLITVFLFVNFNDNKKKMIPKNGKKKKEKIYNQIDTFNNIANT